MADAFTASGDISIDVVAGGDRSPGFASFDPRTGRPHATRFTEASREDVAASVRGAEGAFQTMRRVLPPELAELLRTIARGIEAAVSDLAKVADTETALGPERLRAECARAAAQFDLFADVVEGGDHLGDC